MTGKTVLRLSISLLLAAGPSLPTGAAEPEGGPVVAQGTAQKPGESAGGASRSTDTARPLTTTRIAEKHDASASPDQSRTARGGKPNTAGKATAGGSSDGGLGPGDARKAQPGSIVSEAIRLRAEAARLDDSLKKFELHATTYKNGALHKKVEGGSSGSRPHSPVEQENNGAPAGHSKKAVKQHLDNVKQLTDEYQKHVKHYRKLVNQFNQFYEQYKSHWQRYKSLIARYTQDNAKAALATNYVRDHLRSVANGDRVIEAETRVTSVLSCMFKLLEESPYLSESYLCPAYEDLQREFVQVVAGLTTSVQAVPADERSTVAQDELLTLAWLRREMSDAEAVHKEKELLRKQFSQLMQDTKIIHRAAQSLHR